MTALQAQADAAGLCGVGGDANGHLGHARSGIRKAKGSAPRERREYRGVCVALRASRPEAAQDVRPRETAREESSLRRAD